MDKIVYEDLHNLHFSDNIFNVFKADSEIDNMYSVHEEKKCFQNLVQNIGEKITWESYV
jgi:hypothetical protein